MRRLLPCRWGNLKTHGRDVAPIKDGSQEFPYLKLLTMQWSCRLFAADTRGFRKTQASIIVLGMASRGAFHPLHTV